MIHFIKSLFKNKIIFFLTSQYLAYFTKFINTILIATILGPYYFGIWGFITLLLQYLSYSNCGLQYSTNVLLSTIDRSDQKKASEIASTSILATFWISLLLIILGIFMKIFNIDLFPKYTFNEYLFYVIIITVLAHFNIFFVNVYRSYGYLFKVGLYQLVIELGLIPIILIYKGEKLITALLVVTILLYTISFILFLMNPPVRIKIFINSTIIKLVFTKGIYLLLYNISFYLILISSRTIISLDYTVEEMGFFSYAYNLSIAIFLGLQTILWIFFPKILHKLRHGVPNNEAIRLINHMRYLYIYMVFLITFLFISLFPAFIHFFKEYQIITSTFTLLVLTQAVLSLSFGYADLIISRGFEIKLAIYGFITIVINCSIGLFFSRILHLDFSYIALTALISVFYYILMTVYLGHKLVDKKLNFFSMMKELLPLNLLIPFLIIFLGVFSKYYIYFDLFGTFMFLLLSYKKIFEVFKLSKVIFTNPGIGDF